MNGQMITEGAAWQAYENKDYTLAEQIWAQLINNEKDTVVHERYLSHYCYTLVALKKFENAREIYQSLYQKKKNHIYAHQLAMVEREAGNYEAALAYLRVEETLIESKDHLSISANNYEYGKIKELQGNIKDALFFANECQSHAQLTDDLVLHACAYRLYGDIYSHYQTQKATNYYLKSIKKFEQAKDMVGSKEVEENIKQLCNSNKDS